MKHYWQAIDKAFVDLKCTPAAITPALVYTPQFLDHCRSLLGRAAGLQRPAGLPGLRADRRDGLKNAASIASPRRHEPGRLRSAKKVYDDLLAAGGRQGGLRGCNTPSITSPLRRSWSSTAPRLEPRASSYASCDEWKLAYDEAAAGRPRVITSRPSTARRGRGGDVFEDAGRPGLADRKTVMWYRAASRRRTERGTVAAGHRDRRHADGVRQRQEDRQGQCFRRQAMGACDGRAASAGVL